MNTLILIAIVVVITILVIILAGYFFLPPFVRTKTGGNMIISLIKASKESLTNAGRRVVYHYVDWCPACKSMNPVWYQVKQSLAGNNGVVLVELNEDIAKTDGIRDFPTIDMIDEFGTRRVYNGTANPASIRNWILAPQ